MSAERWFSDALNLRAQGDFCAKRQDWRGAYRAYGMATEHLLKAIYLRNTQQKEMPAHMRTAASHDLSWLAGAAGLGQQIARFTGARKAYWRTVRDWNQGKRYPNEPFPAKEGQDFKAALLNPTQGIWLWLSNHYQST